MCLNLSSTKWVYRQPHGLQPWIWSLILFDIGEPPQPWSWLFMNPSSIDISVIAICYKSIYGNHISISYPYPYPYPYHIISYHIIYNHISVSISVTIPSINPQHVQDSGLKSRVKNLRDTEVGKSRDFRQRDFQEMNMRNVLIMIMMMIVYIWYLICV